MARKKPEPEGQPLDIAELMARPFDGKAADNLPNARKILAITNVVAREIDRSFEDHIAEYHSVRAALTTEKADSILDAIGTAVSAVMDRRLAEQMRAFDAAVGQTIVEIVTEAIKEHERKWHEQEARLTELYRTLDQLLEGRIPPAKEATA